MSQPPPRSRPESTSFWRQPGELLLYPLRGAALLSLIVLTVFGVLAWLPGIGWLMSIVAYFSGYYYAFEILLRTANGRNDSPAVAIEAQTGAVWRLLLVLLLLLLSVKLAQNQGLVPLGLLLLALFALLQPCLLASLATGEGLLVALNPANALRMIERMGVAYFLVAGALFAFQLMVLLASKMLASWMPAFFAALLVDAVFYWGLFASFHLLGRAMYQFHERLGYTPSLHADALPTVQDRDQALLERANFRTSEDDLPGAIALLREEIREHTVTIAVHERYRQLLRQAGDSEALDEHAGRCIAMLAQASQDRPALALLREAVADNPGFARLDPGHGEGLAKRALELGQFRLAVDAWLAMLRLDPRHPNAVEWALQAAQFLHERFNDAAAAQAALRSARDGLRDAAAIARLNLALRALPTPAGSAP